MATNVTNATSAPKPAPKSEPVILADGVYTVEHPALYMVVKGKSQHVKPGTELKKLTEKQVKKLGKKIKLVTNASKVEVN